MLRFLLDNSGTLLTGLVVAGIVAAIIVKLVRDKKNGRHPGCDCGCAGCPNDGVCSTK